MISLKGICVDFGAFRLLNEVSFLINRDDKLGLVGRNGDLYFDEGADQLRLPEKLARQVADRVGQDMVLGIRPESLAPVHAGRFPGADNVLNVTVSVVEPLGDKMDLYVQTPRHEHVVCRVDADRALTDGMRLPMHVNMEQVHVFEPGDEGVNVSLTGTGDHASAA